MRSRPVLRMTHRVLHLVGREVLLVVLLEPLREEGHRVQRTAQLVRHLGEDGEIAPRGSVACLGSALGFRARPQRVDLARHEPMLAAAPSPDRDETTSRVCTEDGSGH